MNALAKRLARLERPTHKVPGDCLFLSLAGHTPDAWRGINGNVSREWFRRPEEDEDQFKARVKREALPLGIVCIVSFEPETPAVAE